VSGSIASGQIGVTHLISGLITTLTLGSGQVNSGNIASGVVFRLLSGNITSGFIGDNAVVSGSIASGNVGKYSLTSGLVPSFTINASAPSSPLYGDRWFDTNTGTLLTYIYDGATAQWVQ